MNKDIKYPQLRLLIDVIGSLAAVGFVIMMVFCSYFKNDTTGFELGINLTGELMPVSMTFLSIVIICAVASIVLQRIK